MAETHLLREAQDRVSAGDLTVAVFTLTGNARAAVYAFTEPLKTDDDVGKALVPEGPGSRFQMEVEVGTTSLPGIAHETENLATPNSIALFYTDRTEFF